MSRLDGVDNKKRKPRGLLRILSFLAIAISIGIIAGFLFSFIVQAFALGFEQGIRSLAAGILPLIVITYITYFTTLFRPPNAPSINVYIVFSLWTLGIFILAALFYDDELPISEFLFSLTLGLYMSISNRQTFEAFLACSYGILSGFLIYIVFLA